MIKKISPLIFILIISFILIQNVYAFGWETTCINETHLLKTANIAIENTIYSLNQTIFCNYGCIYNSCIESPIMASGWAFLIIFAISLLFIFKKDKIISIFGSIIILLLGIWILSEGLYLFGSFINNNLTYLFGFILLGLGIYKIYSNILNLRG